jgi:acyl carrier protein
MKQAAAISERIRSFLLREEEFKFRPDVRDDASLIDAGVVDSFGLIALVIHLEEEFGVKVNPEEATADRLRSVSSIADYIETKLNGNNRG